MLGKFVKVRVTFPIHSFNKRHGFRYKLNYGVIENEAFQKYYVQGVYIMGVSHPVKNFDGRVVAIIRRSVGKGAYLVVAPKNTRYIINDIKPAIAFAEGNNKYRIECYYESSCGAVVFKSKNSKNKFLLIKNKRSAHWGFPKGHIELGETREETAVREVKEETGLDISIFPNFVQSSDYMIKGKIEKNVSIFLAQSSNSNYVMQEEEIDACGWFSYEKAFYVLFYQNDKQILKKARQYIIDNNI